MTELHYDVVALSMPVVYNPDGDHDRNGMLYTLRAYRPLLRWARDRWEDDDEYLPRLHRKSILAAQVVDGLDRYERMRERVSAAGGPVRSLLEEYGGEGEVRRRDEMDGGTDVEIPDGLTRAHVLAVRQNYRDTVDEVVGALTELTSGRVDRLDPDPHVRRRWAAEWREVLEDVEEGIEQRLASMEPDAGSGDHRRFDAEALAERTGEPGERLTPDRVRRLLLNDLSPGARAAGATRYDRFNPMKPLPLARPLVLRARLGDVVTVTLENQLGRRGDSSLLGPRHVGLHLQGEGLAGPDGEGRGAGVRFGDGASVGRNPDTTVPPRQRRTFVWECPHEGTWLFNDLADIRGSERGSNAHGLFGALVVEPAGSTWRDPETGEVLTGTPFADGLDVDILMDDERPGTPEHADFVDFHLDNVPRSHRELTVFLHDEPDVHSPLHDERLDHAVMPISYRAEPMMNRVPFRLRRMVRQTPAEPPPDQSGIDMSAVMSKLNDELTEEFWIGRTPEGSFVERVAGEEQHHSSWLFGDPAIPVQRSYRGDPTRIRLLHAGVKETHVYHLHVHQWRAVAQDTAPPSTWRADEPRGSQLLDSITIGPQTATTIDPLYGAGSRQRTMGDSIWHCHLYPHFHHGMWGLWRSFDRRVDGDRPYPDGAPCAPLVPLPGREPPASTDEQPGFPWFIDAAYPQKSPPPPAIREEDRVGRRRLLRLPLHSQTERAAFDPGCLADPRPGSLFVDLDRLALEWNHRAGLPPPRVVSYDVEVDTQRIEYSSSGWHDPNGHFYRLTGISVSQLDEDGAVVETERFDPPKGDASAIYPRANHGDIVEWRMHNTFTAYPADHFDLGVPPVECGLHVHLVKFDALAADGSSTGWNYLSGASAPGTTGPEVPGALPGNVGLHRWIVDEEFGTTFFHDHLLANFRQKRGLSGALVAEPHGSRWLLPDQSGTAWCEPQAVIVPPPGQGLPPYREAGLNIGDFVPLYDRDGHPLNPPNRIGGVSDPGVMGVNLRCEPLHDRGDDPSLWFATRPVRDGDEDDPAYGRHSDPVTPIVDTYPGERLRIRLLQGSHEEQHSFVAHGLRWRKDWHHEGVEEDGFVRGAPPLVNQQTIGISEAFTLDIDPDRDGPYGPGDHLWSFSAIDDLWLGCWGLVRAHLPSKDRLAALPPLPVEGGEEADPADVVARIAGHRPPDPPLPRDDGTWSAPVREFVVRVTRTEHEYSELLTDPWGLVYQSADGWEPVTDDEGRDTGHRRATGVQDTDEPLVLRVRRGEWIRLTLLNEVLDTEGPADPMAEPFGPEVNPPRVPVEHRDDNGYPVGRTVSPRVSLHPSLMLYDVVDDDGSYVGRNHDSTAGHLPLDAPAHAGHGYGPTAEDGVVFRDDHHSHDGNWVEYWWYADELLAPASAEDGIGQVCYLHDMADIRNHRHHGLIGAVVVLPGDVTPVDPATGDERWTGVTARIDVDSAPRSAEEPVIIDRVLFIQDGLRHFVAGNPQAPLPDSEPGIDPVDAGQKGISYRSALTGRRMLAQERPPTPLLSARTEDRLWLRLVGACDKPRNHTFNVHGVALAATPWREDTARIGALSGITAASTHDLTLQPRQEGDHAYRTGVFRWHLREGMWGILRVGRREG